MTTPQGAAAVAEVTALDAALAKALADVAAAQGTNAELLVAQGQDRATIAAQQQTITELQTELAALQPKPVPASGTLFGTSLSPVAGETWTQAAARTEKTLGPITVWRVYDSANGPTWLLNKLKASGLLDGRRTIVASVKHVDDGMDGLIQAVDYVTINHEPDQGYDKGGPRVTPAQLAPQLKDLRSRIDRLGRTGKCKLMLILTGTNYAPRLKAYMDAIGSGVVDVLGVDPYASKGTAASLVAPLITAGAAYKLPVAVTEIGMTTATPDATVTQFVASMRDLTGKVEFVTWFNQHGAAALGNRIDNTPAASAFKAAAAT